MRMRTSTSTVRPRRDVRFAAAVSAAVLLAGCASDRPGGARSAAGGAPAEEAFPASVESCGYETTVEAAPERAVTMNQGATEVMLALGLADRMVSTAFLDDPVADRWADEYAGIPVLAEEYPDTETLLEAEPDFVYGSYVSAFEGDAAGPQEDLADLGIASYVSPFGCGGDVPGKSAGADGVSFDDVWGELRDIGALFGVSDRAEELIAEQEELLADPSIATAGEGLTVFWYDSGEDAPSAGAGQGGPQLLIESVGATNVFADVGGTWADVGWERVLDADPDVIVLAAAAWSTAEEKQRYLEADPALSDLTAVRERRYAVVAFSETSPGVRNADGVVSLAEQLGGLDG
jgi:iron complex transport system substrate-binding protein